MKNIHIMELNRKKIYKKTIVILTLFLLIYLIVSLYFMRHYFFKTSINGVDVSLKSYRKAEELIRQSLEDFSLELQERSGETEVITSREIGLRYNEGIDISELKHKQKAYRWMNSLFKDRAYYIDELFVYDTDMLEDRLKQLHCLNRDVTESQNVSFRYGENAYEAVEEVYGDRVNMEKLRNAVDRKIVKGFRELNLKKEHCYEEPRYKLSSEKTKKTMTLLNQYVAAHITYQFGNKNEIVDGKLINKWLTVDQNLDVEISRAEVMIYIKGLGKKYDTVGVSRSFKTSTGKTVDIKGGLYGWKIDQKAELEALTEHIKSGMTIVKEPVYTRKAFSRDNEIGNTYVEINITKQQLWFYKDGKLIAQGYVVTGNPNRGNATVVGINSIIYKQKEATLTGPGYEAKVTYWMPFYGNIGLHDASWRSSFGGEIYKSRGTHGCVNLPYFLAKKIFDNIEEGTPVIVYKEE